MTAPVTQRISDAVRLELVHQGKSQIALAEAIGMKQAAMSRRMSGRVAFRTDELERVAQFLGVTVSDLYAGPGRVAVA